ncbi:hypothetical protein CR155_13515 [Pollutimonas nitritireducens]|uniref:ABC transporter substrate-binding protein n=1 Tax=Pollutimonas nitritireducens TaxID=2045209 RepID=A0A2N4UE45_9BURK|nr:tripartite tricarboxylate transporter substrate binding protein [Pollutimonas nitritireducens]PLC53295.1 hypothetical protein CR155_13515 [Pollutimonas nitritireducens]
MRLLKNTIICSLIAVGSALTAGTTWASSYPSKPVKLVIPFSAGGPTDILGRQIAEELRIKWGQPVVVENKPGANAIIGSQQVAQASADGYTLVLATQTSHAANASMYTNLSYDPVKDFEPVSLIATTPLVLLVNPALPVNSVKELVEYAKKNPGKINYAGGSSSAQAGGALLGILADVDMMHVSYKSNAPAFSDLLGGHVNMMFNVWNAAASYVESGKLKALAVTSPNRSKAAPDVPTMMEAGVPDYELVPWFAIFAPANTPKDVVAKVSGDIAGVLEVPRIKELLKAQTLEPVGSTPEELKAFQAKEIDKWAKIVERANMKIQ